MVTDRLSVANALEAANIDRPVAERIATELYDGIHNNVATKADLAQLRTELAARIDLIEHRLLTRHRFHMRLRTALAYHRDPPGDPKGTVTSSY